MSDADRIQEGRPAAEEAPAGVRLHGEQYRHPLRVDLVRLVVYEVAEGFLVTQERVASATVVATLGTFDSRDGADGLLRERARQLTDEGFARVD